MRFLLDSNVCITLLRSASKAGSPSPVATRLRAKLDAHEAGGRDVFVCSVVRFEVLTGALKSRRQAEDVESALTLLGAFQAFPFNDAAAERAAQVRVALETAGTPVGPNDLLIAAIALANDLTLVTHNTSEFSRVPGLAIEDWEVDAAT